MLTMVHETVIAVMWHLELDEHLCDNSAAGIMKLGHQ